MSIGTTIKKLRRERDMTQEQLAEYLGITANSVSQWECDRTAPDISVLPALANIFEVTTDSLLGVDVTKKTKKIDSFIAEAWEKCSSGDKEAALLRAKEGLKEFPNSFKLMLAAATFLFQRAFQQDCTDDEQISFCTEAAAYIDSIISSCMDMDTRAKAIELACSVFPKVGRYDEAVSLADTFPTVTKDELYLNLYSGEKLHDHLKKMICKNITAGADLMNWLASRGNCTDDERLSLYHKSLTLFRTLYENGDYFFDGESVALVEENIAAIWAERKNADEALHYLADSVSHLIDFDTYNAEEAKFTSIIPKGSEVPGINYNDSTNACGHMLERIKAYGGYDFLKTDPRYADIMDKLKKASRG